MKLLVSSSLWFNILKRQKLVRCFSHAQPTISKSYFFKNGTVPLSCLTIGEVLDKTADDYGDHILHISHHQGISRTYLKARNEAEKLASGLIACGLRKGDRLGIYSPNCIEWPIAQYAAAKAGLIAVAINYACQPSELEYCLKKTNCKAVVSYDKLKHQNYYDVFKAIIPNLENSDPMNLQSEKLPNLKSIIMLSDDTKEGIIRYKDVMNMGNKESDTILEEVKKHLKFDDLLNIQYTSGTTGAPKAAGLSHHNIVTGAVSSLQAMEYSAEEHSIGCCQVPLFHLFGVMFGIFWPLFKKQTVVLPSSVHDGEKNLEAIEKYRCNLAVGTPTMFIDVLRIHEQMKSDVSSLKHALLSGAAIPEGVLNGLYNDFKFSTIQRAYGLSEGTAAVALTSLNSNRDEVLGGFMEPIAGIEVKIIDSEDQLVPRNVTGEICTRSRLVFQGYWGDQEATAKAIDKFGWLHTGDIGIMNDKGWINIVGRFKDIVIRGGENICVIEIENFLSCHPAILESYICGVPDERLGEELCCWIHVKPGMTLTEEDVRKFCQGKISYYKIPRYILFVDEFPKTKTGKAQKHEMAKISIEKLGL
ncbi:medium-chain acyl-CoA ligase ACSF2, mitochondrial-like [Parasteatoda tepidariorum]|uniref:medium-chain acyl-CoA ligase ACSF2, mitochondrial-like n=1 Tax=Parasteatoda tepidariorum TaxID=114398 RepID=UPI0039BD68F5